MRMMRYLAIAVLMLGVVGMVMGAVFIGQGVYKSNWLTQAMQQEKVMLPLHGQNTPPSQIDTAEEAQAAADLIREHRRSIAPTYQDLLGEGRYDPSNPNHLTYTQALNMENYLYMGVLAFGVTIIAMASGAFMILMGVALVATGVALLRLGRGPYQTSPA